MSEEKKDMNQAEDVKDEMAKESTDETTGKQENKTVEEPAEDELKKTNEEPGAKENKKTGEEDDDEADFDFSQFLPDNMEEVLKFQVMQLREWAYIYMGLLPHPKKKIVVKDAAQAKMAIDSAAAISDIIMPGMGEKDAREIKIMISDLKMNYISHANS